MMRLSLLVVCLAVGLLQVALGQKQLAMIAGKKVALFAVAAGSGRNVLSDYRNIRFSGALSKKQKALPRASRPTRADRFREVIEAAGASYIVAEMHKNDSVVASAVFSIGDIDGVDPLNWFTADRLVASDPFPVGRDAIFDLSAGKKRAFFVHKKGGDCSTDGGLMGIGMSSSDPCPWVTNGGAVPVLFYSTKKGAYKDTVQYADQFLVYIISKSLFRKEMAAQRTATSNG